MHDEKAAERRHVFPPPSLFWPLQLLARALREGVPILILAGSAGDLLPQRSAAAGVRLVGQKPLSFAELTAHMEQLLGRGDTADSR
jgi:hypothetical protein